jgi:hypothetical protein
LKFPPPTPGLVIPYSFLWSSEAAKGQEEGTKYRPCAITIARLMLDGRQSVRVLPITHRSPANRASAVEIPRKTKLILGLDSERSWIILDEVNDFVWPGPDLRPPSGDTASLALGRIPNGLLRIVLEKMIARAREGHVKVTRRTD